MLKIIILTASIVVCSFFLYERLFSYEMVSPHIPQPVFVIRSVDTMKYSRDFARDKQDDPAFNAVMDKQVKAIAGIGATHVAIATPYDEEFVPYLTSWVTAARKYGLHVWFRGNLSGWEGWFDYPQISRDEHTEQVTKFVLSHGSLFQDGDIFTACPECENGGPGDPRLTGDLEGFRTFLIQERESVRDAFLSLGKNVSVDVQSMNYDVASLVMDRVTTAALGGIVGIDHYVLDPVRLSQDVVSIAESSGGQVFLGEYGAPIPDIHGDMTEDEQAEWIRKSLEALSTLKSVAGVNYWVAVGGSTEIWKSDGTPTLAVEVLKKYYTLLK